MLKGQIVVAVDGRIRFAEVRRIEDVAFPIQFLRVRLAWKRAAEVCQPARGARFSRDVDKRLQPGRGKGRPRSKPVRKDRGAAVPEADRVVIVDRVGNRTARLRDVRVVGCRRERRGIQIERVTSRRCIRIDPVFIFLFVAKPDVELLAIGCRILKAQSGAVLLEERTMIVVAPVGNARGTAGKIG